MEYDRKVCILVPTSRYIPSIFISSFAAALSEAQGMGMKISYHTDDHHQIDIVRQGLLGTALKERPRPMYLFWLDTDIELDGKMARRLYEFMEAHPEADAASGIYFRRDYMPACLKELGGERRPFLPKEVCEVDAVGMGCMICRTESLVEKLPSVSEGTCFVYKEETMSEDTYFCLQMKKAGMKLFALPDVLPRHFGGFVGKEHYEKLL